MTHEVTFVAFVDLFVSILYQAHLLPEVCPVFWWFCAVWVVFGMSGMPGRVSKVWREARFNWSIVSVVNRGQTVSLFFRCQLQVMSYASVWTITHAQKSTIVVDNFTEGKLRNLRGLNLAKATYCESFARKAVWIFSPDGK